MDIIKKTNKHSKPRTKPVHGILVHSIAEKLKGHGPADEFLESIGLSAHYLIYPNGDILETVSPNRVAYHAGISKWENEEGLNSTYIGIEFVVPGEHDYMTFLSAIRDQSSFSEEQYISGSRLCCMLKRTHMEISSRRIARHSDVSGPDVRPGDPKLDPGKGFQWNKFKSYITECDTGKLVAPETINDSVEIAQRKQTCWDKIKSHFNA